MENIVFLGAMKGKFRQAEVVYVTIENPVFCLSFYLTGVYFRCELQQVGRVGEQKSSIDQSELEK